MSQTIVSKKIIQYLVLGLSLSLSSWTLAAVREYHLHIDEKAINLTGKFSKKITVNGQFPAPILEFEEGDEAVIHVHNQLKNQDTSIHWHGLLLPALMDGVPDFNQFAAIKPNGHFEYRFKIRQNGTYWYHAHSKGQEQDGLYGAFIIYPKGKMPIAEHEQVENDYVVMLSDFHESSGEQIMKNLKKSAEYYQNQRETLFDVFKQVQHEGLKSTWQDRKMWNQMRMLKTDLSDVTGYTFLVNGQTPTQNWTSTFKPNQKIRLRFINASAMSFFDVRIPNLKMTVVSADGQAVQPIAVDEFRIGTAETYDVIVEPTASHYQIEAESIDRAGFALATLQQENTAKIAIQMPSPRPRALLTMDDMGHGMPQDHTQQNHAHHHSDQHQAKAVEGWANMFTPQGHKALQYADLKSLTKQTDIRPPEREIEIRLGGIMERYIWTMNGKKFNQATPINVQYGERIRLKFVNESMMAHPMHLHGMFMQLENGQKLEDLPNKHTVIVPPNKTVSLLLTADELGEWAIHCHLLYHMTAGMMNKLVVAHVDPKQPLPPQDHPQSHSQQGESHHAHH